MRLQGRVVKRTANAGSKSESEQVMLELDDGTTWYLRRPGGNPFSDPRLDALVGSTVTIEGRPQDQYFFIESVVDDAE